MKASEWQRFRGIAAICAAAVFLSITSANADFAAMGIGLQSCGEFAKQHQIPNMEDVYYQWAQGFLRAQGFLSGVNAKTTDGTRRARRHSEYPVTAQARRSSYRGCAMSTPTDTIHEVAINPIQVKGTNASDFSTDGLVVTKPLEILSALGYTNIAGILDRLPAICRGGVQTAAVGVIQDPAGSAIGTGTQPSGGGASGAIYAKFPDLKPIDKIAPRSAIFNRSNGAGCRVLHTHSPMLEGKPASESATSSVLEDLSNSYYNALVGANERSGAMGKDGTLLNLVPVSANIFAGAFARNNHGSLHLDPSYTLTAIMVAVGEMLKGNLIVGELALYYFSPELYQDAVNLVEGLKTRKS